MGIADIDFRAAPAITKAINERVKHENWGYLDMGKWTPMLTEAIAAWNKRALRRDDRSDDDRDLRRRAPGADRRAQDLLADGQQGAAADADLQRLLFAT